MGTNDLKLIKILINEFPVATAERAGMGLTKGLL